MDESRRKRVVAISVVVGFLAAFPLMAAAAFVYLRYGDPPVSTADKPFPYEETIVQIPLNARIDRQLATAPLSPTSDNLVAGVHVSSLTAPFAMENRVKTAAWANGDTPLLHNSGQNTQTASSASVMILRMFPTGR
jgi:hypothetical protein